MATKAQLQGEINRLTSEKESLQSQVTGLNITLDQERESARIALEAKTQQKDAELAQKDQKIEALQTEIEEKQHKIDIRELKKFAEAYGEQEIQFEGSAKQWFNYSLISFAAAIIGTLLVVILTQDLVWYKRIGYYVVDLILFTPLVFSLHQYSYYIKLSTDYGNRKTLAQSYHNVINSAEDDVIKNKFLDKASEVLASPAEVEVEANTVPEKILESITEIAKNLSRK